MLKNFSVWTLAFVFSVSISVPSKAVYAEATGEADPELTEEKEGRLQELFEGDPPDSISDETREAILEADRKARQEAELADVGWKYFKWSAGIGAGSGIVSGVSAYLNLFNKTISPTDKGSKKAELTMVISGGLAAGSTIVGATGLAQSLMDEEDAKKHKREREEKIREIKKEGATQLSSGSGEKRGDEANRATDNQ